MKQSHLNPPVFDIRIRVGCHLVYEATGPSTLLLNIQPLRDRQHLVVAETLNLGSDQSVQEYIDSHGNHVYRLSLRPGSNIIHHDAIVAVVSQPDNYDFTDTSPVPIEELPPELLRYTLPSRYCDSDKLTNFAWEKFGHIEHGLPRVQAISQWLHNNIEYTYFSGRPDLSAGDVLNRGYGVCRDFAHLAVALNRTFNLPARYVTGHLADIGFPDVKGHMDFHAYAEVYLGGRWYISDPRFHIPRIGRVKVSCGLDAVDGAFSTIYGGASLSHFEIWAYQITKGSVNVGDPIDLSQRLDNQWIVQTDVKL
ncbi:transglutaminase-like domain-containing protein [Leptospira sp. 'Mane']|uniref:transglutaminase-like domain-containing protein n=1 Tax=Leptospira sp. 'Mane' TaxID=3387407 RepID=UPI00398B3447